MTGPDTPSFAGPGDSSPTWGVKTELKRGEKKELSGAVNGDSAVLPES